MERDWRLWPVLPVPVTMVPWHAAPAAHSRWWTGPASHRPRLV